MFHFPQSKRQRPRNNLQGPHILAQPLPGPLLLLICSSSMFSSHNCFLKHPQQAPASGPLHGLSLCLNTPPLSVLYSLQVSAQISLSQGGPPPPPLPSFHPPPCKSFLCSLITTCHLFLLLCLSSHTRPNTLRVRTSSYGMSLSPAHSSCSRNSC